MTELETHEKIHYLPHHAVVRKDSKTTNIELDHVILDELHLMMRLTDRLTENFISEVMERDSQAGISKGRGEKKGVYLDTLVNTIKGIEISFSICEKKNPDGKGSGSYDWTSLIASEKDAHGTFHSLAGGEGYTLP